MVEVGKSNIDMDPMGKGPGKKQSTLRLIKDTSCLAISKPTGTSDLMILRVVAILRFHEIIPQVVRVFVLVRSWLRYSTLTIVMIFVSGDSWMYPYQRTPMGNPYI